LQCSTNDEEAWMLGRDALSTSMRIRLVDFLRDKEDVCLPGLEVPLGLLPRSRLESWANFLDRIQTEREYFETPLFAAASSLLKRKVVIVTSYPLNDPIVTFEAAGVSEPILIGNIAGKHFMPLAKCVVAPPSR